VPESSDRAQIPLPPPEPNLTEDKHRTIIHQSLARQYRDMLDQPAPIFENKSSRTAAKPQPKRAHAGRFAMQMAVEPEEDSYQGRGTKPKCDIESAHI
jgi:hypothetical protein